MNWQKLKPLRLITAGSIAFLALSWTWSALPWPSSLFVPTWTRSYELYQQPHAIWLSQYDKVGSNLPLLTKVLNAATKTQQIPELVVYSIPLRDLGQSSEGGFANYEDYLADNRLNASHIQEFVTATQLHPVIYLEPDSLPLAVQYRRDHQGDAESQKIYSDRIRAINALIRIYQNAGAIVYLEAGHSGWFDHSDEDIQRIATALNEAGIQKATGLASNISNRQPILGYSPNGKTELHYLKRLQTLLNNPHLDVRIDTSRNGGITTARKYYLALNGQLFDNQSRVGRLVGSWKQLGPDIWLHPFFGKAKLLQRLLEKEHYSWNVATSILQAPEWLDAEGDVKLGPAPTDWPPEAVRSSIQHYRYIKPPDDCDGAINCPPGASKHDINIETNAKQPSSIPTIRWTD